MYSTVKEGGMADLRLVVEIGVYTPAERPFQGCAALPPLHVHQLPDVTVEVLEVSARAPAAHTNGDTARGALQSP